MENNNECSMKTENVTHQPEKLLFTQYSENTPAEIVIVHQPSTEVFLSMLHPAASLYHEATNDTDVKKCFDRFANILNELGIKMYTVRDILKLNKEGLLNLAMAALTYECENEDDGKDNPDFLFYISDEYKRKVLESLTLDQVVDVVLTRPTYKLKYVPRNTYVEPVNLAFRPLGNLLFVRDQQITTQVGVILGRTSTWARELEHLIMHQVFKNIHVNIIAEIPKDAYLEGGDFFVAKNDLSMVGLGMRSNFKAAAFLMDNDLLGTDRFALIIDENDFNQQRMHLDTFFNIVNEKDVVCIDFKELSEIHHRTINRKVLLYVKKFSPSFPKCSLNAKLSIDGIINNNTESDLNVYLNEDTGEYELIKIFDDFYNYLAYENYNVIKINHQHQTDYLINFLNIGNNTVIAVNPELKNVLKLNTVNTKVIDLDFDAVVKMYGAVHCASQVSRKYISNTEMLKYQDVEPELLVMEEIRLEH